METPASAHDTYESANPANDGADVRLPGAWDLSDKADLSRSESQLDVSEAPESSAAASVPGGSGAPMGSELYNYPKYDGVAPHAEVGPSQQSSDATKSISKNSVPAKKRARPRLHPGPLSENGENGEQNSPRRAMNGPQILDEEYAESVVQPSLIPQSSVREETPLPRVESSSSVSDSFWDRSEATSRSGDGKASIRLPRNESTATLHSLHSVDSARHDTASPRTMRMPLRGVRTPRNQKELEENERLWSGAGIGYARDDAPALDRVTQHPFMWGVRNMYEIGKRNSRLVRLGAGIVERSLSTISRPLRSNDPRFYNEQMRHPAAYLRGQPYQRPIRRMPLSKPHSEYGTPSHEMDQFVWPVDAAADPRVHSRYDSYTTPRYIDPAYGDVYADPYKSSHAAYAADPYAQGYFAYRPLRMRGYPGGPSYAHSGASSSFGTPLDDAYATPPVENVPDVRNLTAALEWLNAALSRTTHVSSTLSTFVKSLHAVDWDKDPQADAIATYLEQIKKDIVNIVRQASLDIPTSTSGSLSPEAVSRVRRAILALPAMLSSKTPGTSDAAASSSSPSAADSAGLDGLAELQEASKSEARDPAKLLSLADRATVQLVHFADQSSSILTEIRDIFSDSGDSVDDAKQQQQLKVYV